MTARWWQGAVGYEIYVRSFQDSDGDGLGDLAGVRRRLDVLAELGVDIVWITPFYPSPGADHGYDVSDYTAVDPRFGRLADLDGVVGDAHELGLRVVVDLVPNHTSDQHPWFRDARGGRDAEHRDFYVWRDPASDGGPPNNWVSHFGGPAWTYDVATEQYYLHLFLPEQPDLNWANPAVADAFDEILGFWLDRGVDGFRIDVAHALSIDPGLRDNSLIGDLPAPGASPSEMFDAYHHDHDQDQAEVLGIYQRWNRVVERYDAMLLGEVYLLDPSRLTRYVAAGDGLHSAFCFPVLRTPWDADQVRATLRACVAAGDGRLSWPLSSHDDPHAATRFGGGERGARRQLAYFTLLCALPGIPFLHQGDELGLSDGQIDAAADPIALRNPGANGRDGARTPMPWDDALGFGFTAGEPWLGFGRNRRREDTFEVQRGDPGSHWHRVRELLAARRELTDLHGDEPVQWLTSGGPIVALRRGGVLVACNFAGAAAPFTVSGGWRVAFGSAGEPTLHGDRLEVPGDAAVVLEASTHGPA